MGYSIESQMAYDLITESGTNITIRKKSDSGYLNKCQSYYSSSASLNGAITSSSTACNIDNISSAFASQGTVSIGSEQIHYGTINAGGTKISDLTRGYNSSRAKSHSDNTILYLLTSEQYTDYSGYGVFVPFNRERYIDGTSLREASRSILVPGKNLSITIEQGDIVVASSKEYNVLFVEEIIPDNSTHILYKIAVKG